MKTAILLALMVAGSAFYATAQESKTNDSSKIYFFRTTGYEGSAVAFSLFVDGQFVCKLKNKAYSMHEIPPGKHTCSVQFSGKKSKEGAEKFEFVAEPGKNVYMNVVYQSGVVKDNTFLEEITESSAKNMIKQLKQVMDCN